MYLKIWNIKSHKKFLLCSVLSSNLFLCVDISKVQDDVIGDGTTSVVVLAAELLRVSFIILMGIDVMKICLCISQRIINDWNYPFPKEL